MNVATILKQKVVVFSPLPQIRHYSISQSYSRGMALAALSSWETMTRS
jgi:hypothetical protein